MEWVRRVYLSEMCQPISSVAGRRHLRPAVRRHLAVPRYRLTTAGRRTFLSLARQHGTVFPRTLKTKRLPWTRLSVILNAFCSIRTDSAPSTLEISRNDTALYKCSLIIIMYYYYLDVDGWRHDKQRDHDVSDGQRHDEVVGGRA